MSFGSDPTSYPADTERFFAVGKTTGALNRKMTCIKCRGSICAELCVESLIRLLGMIIKHRNNFVERNNVVIYQKQNLFQKINQNRSMWYLTKSCYTFLLTCQFVYGVHFLHFTKLKGSTDVFRPI